MSSGITSFGLFQHDIISYKPSQAIRIPMRILVTNDDGYLAPGIIRLAAALAALAEVRVVAPDRDRSGASNSLTLKSPLYVTEHDNGFCSVEGTPTDCVHVAITGLLDPEPDMVVSGINAGANLGDDVLYSGTVAGAMEGRYLGLPAIAVSLAGLPPKHFQLKHYDTAARVACRLVTELQNNPLPKDTILNVNVPDLPWEALQGFQATRLGQRHKSEPVVKATDPRGRTIYWVGPAGPEQDAGPGTDFHAIRSGQVSITPLHVDLTRYSALEPLTGWVAGL
jgi:5'-nucleotidase